MRVSPSVTRTPALFMTYLKSEDGVYRKIREVIFFLREDFGRKSSSGNIEKIVTKFGGI